MRKYLFFHISVTILVVVTSYGQSTIQPNFNSSNGWMPDHIGDTNPPLSSPGPTIDATAFTTNPSGIIYGISANTTLISDVSTQGFIRYGGKTQDINFYTQAQAQNFVNFAQNNGLKPVFQIPFLYFYHGTTISNALSASNITTIKNMVTFLKSLGVKYYSISNECDRYHKPPFNENGGVALTETQIASFFKPIAVAIKEVDGGAIFSGQICRNLILTVAV